MVKLSKCCCCVHVKTGAYTIGFLHVVGLLVGIIRLDYLQIALEVFCGATFLLMIYGDNELRRLMYFAAYCVYVIIVTSIRIIFLIWDRDEKVAAR